MTPASILLPDLAAVEKAARQLALILHARDFLALKGPLGAGKTTFTRFLLQALGIQEDVPSPTFTLIQTYETSHFPIYHFDFYRFENEMEIQELGWEDALASGLVIVEWPERIEEKLPLNRLVLRFLFEEDGARLLVFEPQGTWTERLKGLV